MLTNEQCIEIAEKVWGWKSAKKSDWRWESYIATEVNSWQGFGRTLESLRANRNDTAITIIKGEVGNYLRNDGIDSEEELWEATHLAVLEAMKND